MWKKTNQTYWTDGPFEANAFAGIQVKVVDSNKGPSSHLRNALWKTGNTHESDHMVNVKTIYYDPNFYGWEYDKGYAWDLTYNGDKDCMRYTYVHIYRANGVCVTLIILMTNYSEMLASKHSCAIN